MSTHLHLKLRKSVKGVTRTRSDTLGRTVPDWMWAVGGRARDLHGGQRSACCVRVVLVLWTHTASVPTLRGQLQDRKLEGLVAGCGGSTLGLVCLVRS